MINFIDSNCMVGRRMFCREGSPKTTEDIINIMDRAGIDKSVAFHSVAKENDPKTGNDFLEDEIGGNDRFIRQWIVMPDCLSPQRTTSSCTLSPYMPLPQCRGMRAG